MITIRNLWNEIYVGPMIIEAGPYNCIAIGEFIRDDDEPVIIPITESFSNEEDCEKVINWIFEQIKVPKGAEDIIIDLKKCPFLEDSIRE